MKYLKEYSEHSTYEQIWIFDADSPTFDRIKTFNIYSVNRLESILDKISRGVPSSFFKYRSKVDLQPFWCLTWPIWLVRIDDNDMRDEDEIKWISYWRELLIYNLDNKKDPIFKNKQLHFTCELEWPFFIKPGMFNIEIICDDDGYYYVQIDLNGDKKFYKCDQEYGLSDCIKSELKKWEIPKI